MLGRIGPSMVGDGTELLPVVAPATGPPPVTTEKDRHTIVAPTQLAIIRRIELRYTVTPPNVVACVTDCVSHGLACQRPYRSRPVDGADAQMGQGYPSDHTGSICRTTKGSLWMIRRSLFSYGPSGHR